MLESLRGPREGGIRFSMLPGFRFLFTAILLSVSILVFGLGAAALLRTAHEQFASNPAWHAAPDATFAQQAEATRPVLAMLRVEPAPAEQKTANNVAAVPASPEQAANLAPVEEAPAVPTPTEQATIAPPPTGSEQAAAPPEANKPEMPVSENPAPSEAQPAQTDPPAAADETKIASTDQVVTEQTSPPASLALPASSEANPVASEPANASASQEAGIASTKIAALDSPSATVEVEVNAPATTATAKPDQSAAKKRLRARRAAHRRRLAAERARQLLAAQQAANPFAPFIQPPVAARKPLN